jgi:hypothetical protein
MPGGVLVNGTNYSYSNVSFMLFGIVVTGITKISYRRKQNKENNYGWGDKPISRGYGNYEYEGSIELYMDEWKKIIAAAPNRDPFQIPPFDIPVVFGGTRVTADKDVLRSAEFTEDGFDASQGDTKLLVTVPLIIGDIER